MAGATAAPAMASAIAEFVGCGDAVELAGAALQNLAPRRSGKLALVPLVACKPERDGGFEEFAAGLFAALPDPDDDSLFCIGIDGLGASLFGLFA